MWNYNSFTYLTLPPYLVRNGNIPVTVTFTNLEKLGDGGSFKGKIKGKDISFSLYNQCTNAKVEGKIPEDLAFSDNDFEGQYGPHPDQD
jgi:hypothetical protein